MRLPDEIILDILDYLHPKHLVRFGIICRSVACRIIPMYRLGYKFYKDLPIKTVLEHAILNKNYNWIVWAATEFIRLKNDDFRVKLRASVIREFMNENNYKIFSILMSIDGFQDLKGCGLILLNEAIKCTDQYFVSYLTNGCDYSRLHNKILDRLLYTALKDNNNIHRDALYEEYLKRDPERFILAERGFGLVGMPNRNQRYPGRINYMSQNLDDNLIDEVYDMHITPRFVDDILQCPRHYDCNVCYITKSNYIRIINSSRFGKLMELFDQECGGSAQIYCLYWKCLKNNVNPSTVLNCSLYQKLQTIDGNWGQTKDLLKIILGFAKVEDLPGFEENIPDFTYPGLWDDNWWYDFFIKIGYDPRENLQQQRINFIKKCLYMLTHVRIDDNERFDPKNPLDKRECQYTWVDQIFFNDAISYKDHDIIGEQIYGAAYDYGLMQLMLQCMKKVQFVDEEDCVRIKSIHYNPYDHII